MRRLALALVGAALSIAGCGADEPAKDLFAGCSREPGTICTVAGTGVAADGPDLKLPRETRLHLPTDMAFSPAGVLHIIDWNNHRIRALQPDGTLKVIAGEGELSAGLVADEVGSRLNHPTDIIFDPQGRMIIAAWHNSRIKRYDPTTGIIEDIAGTGGRAFGGDGGPAAMAVMDLPVSVVLDERGNLYVSDQANQRVRCIDPAGIIRTVAGSGERGFAGDGGPVLSAKFNLPIGQMGHPAAKLARDAAGRLYLADTLNNRIRQIDLAADRITTVAGNGTLGADGDGGPATEAQLAEPVDVAVGPDGALYVADTDNDCVRRIQDGRITTFAGRCGVCNRDDGPACRCPGTDAACLGDNRRATEARLHRPYGIAFDPAGNLFVADTLNHRIRVVFR